MDYARDELRRQTAAIDAAHRPLVAKWRSALDQIFDPANRDRSDATQRAAVLGVPDRRQFLRIGGLAVAGSAILVACGSDEDDSAGSSSTTAAETTSTTAGTESTTTTTAPDGAEMDLTLLRTASSIEILAINAYQAAVDSGLVTDQAVADAALLFQSQHEDHNAALQAQTEQLGGEPYTEPNPYLQENVVGPALEAVTDQLSVVQLALELENAAAQTYALAGGILSSPELRQTIMSIGGVEARHAAVLYGVIDGAGPPQVPVPFMPTEGAAPEESFV